MQLYEAATTEPPNHFTNQSINQSINQSDYQLLRVCSSGKEIRPVANDPFVAASEEAASLPPCHRNHPLAAAPGGGKGTMPILRRILSD